MKYTFKLIGIIIYVIVMIGVFVWHFDFKHFISYDDFWDFSEWDCDGGWY